MSDEKDLLTAAINAVAPALVPAPVPAPAPAPAPAAGVFDTLLAAVAAMPYNTIEYLRSSPAGPEARAMLKRQRGVVPVVAAATAAVSAAADDAVAAGVAAADGDAVSKSLGDARSAVIYTAAARAAARQLAGWVRRMPKSTPAAVAAAEGAARAADAADGVAAPAARRCHELVEAGYIDEDHKAVVAVAAAAAAEIATEAAADACRAHADAVIAYYKTVLASYGEGLPDPLFEPVVIFPPKKKQKNGTPPSPRLCGLELRKAVRATLCVLSSLDAPTRVPRPTNREVRAAFIRARLRLRLFPGATTLMAECGMGQTVFKHHIDTLCLSIATRMWWATPREQWNFVCVFDNLLDVLDW